MDHDKLIENINEERAFLHDISTPVMVLRLTVENLMESSELGEQAKSKLERAFRATTTLSEKIESRRSTIKDQQSKLSEGEQK